MKDIIRSANKVMAALPDGFQDLWVMVIQDTEAFKGLSEEEKEEAANHLQELMDAK